MSDLKKVARYLEFRYKLANHQDETESLLSSFMDKVGNPDEIINLINLVRDSDNDYVDGMLRYVSGVDATFMVDEGMEESQSSDNPLESLRKVIESLTDSSGLASVPEVSRQMPAGSDTKKLLLEAYREGWLELRPEGGMNRLSDADAALCPVGAGGIPLSWCRLR
jgi:hypothetical protein